MNETIQVPVSVIVPIKNEAGNLRRCLGSVNFGDEIFVVDSQSSDGSIEIAQEEGARVVQFRQVKIAAPNLSASVFFCGSSPAF
jgi:glycosyltransferase involved in cell wall biosynthesis